MKKVVAFMLVFVYLFQQDLPANAAVVNYGNLRITLPDTVVITGSETGTDKRSCTFQISVDAAPGTTIPLRASVNIGLQDSLGTSIDSGYSMATVEGLTHQEFIGVFHCSNIGTLKPPYKFSGAIFGIPNLWPNIEAPVNVNFVPESIVATPTPSSNAPQNSNIGISEKSKNECLVFSANQGKDKILKIAEIYKLRADLKVSSSEIKSSDKIIKKFTELMQFDCQGITETFWQSVKAERNTEIDKALANFDAMYLKYMKMKGTTITCYKAGVTKKVSGKSPVCSKGYKKVS
jgi:hypothetical protein